MIRGRAAMALMLVAMSPIARADDGVASLIGVWRLQSFSLEVQGEVPREIFGPDPNGYLIFTPEGRVMTIVTRANRKPATTVYERAALLDSMVSYTGRYVVEGDRIWIKVDVAWNEIFTGTEQIRYFTLDGDNLWIRTAPQLSAILPGETVVGALSYAREK